MRLREAVGAQPFRPFTVSLADGRRLRVRSPEYVWIPPKAQRTFHVASVSGDEECVIDLLLVTSLAFGNGRTQKRNRSA